MELLTETSRKKSLTHEFRVKKGVETKCELLHSHFFNEYHNHNIFTICIAAVAKFVFLSGEL